jgi:hypothetical protein
VTRDEKWKVRAHQLAQLSFDQTIANKVKSCPEKFGRKVSGVPDAPFSLLQGIGGDIVVYADMIKGNGLFPGYEL